MKGILKAAPKGVKKKRGRGSQSKSNVAVMAESTPLEDIETGRKIVSNSRYDKNEGAYIS